VNGPRAIAVVSLLLVAVTALAVAVALLAARGRVRNRSALASPLTFALLALAGGGAVGALALATSSDTDGVAAALLGLVAAGSLLRVVLLQREHVALVGGASSVEDARAAARTTLRALAASARLAERLEAVGDPAEVEGHLLEAAHRAIGDSGDVSRVGPSAAQPAASSLDVRCDLGTPGVLRVEFHTPPTRQLHDGVATIMRTLAAEAMLGYERAAARGVAGLAALRDAVVQELDRKLAAADDVFGAAHIAAQAAGTHLGAAWAELHGTGAAPLAFTLDGAVGHDDANVLHESLGQGRGELVLGLRATPAPTDATLAEAIASSLGRALELLSSRATATSRRTRQLALSRAATALSSGDAAVRTVLTAALDALRGDLACAYLVRGGVPVAIEVVGGERVDRCDGAASQAIATGRPVVDGDGRFLDGAAPDGMHAAVAAPIPGAATARGALSVLYREPPAMSEGDGGDLAAFAHLAALVIDRVQLERELERRERLRSGFVEIAEGLAGPREPHETYVALADAAARALRSQAAVVVVQRDGVLHAEGASPAAPSLVGEDGAAGALLELAARDGRVVLCTDARSDRRIPPEHRRRMVEAGQLSAICVPIAYAGGDGRAVLGAVWATPRGAADDELELARHLATAASAAIERAEVLAAERRARARAQELQRIGGLMASSLDAPAVLREIVSQAALLLHADSCALRLVEGDRLVVRAVQGAAAELLTGEETTLSGGPTGEVLARRTPLAIADMAADDRFLPDDPLLRADFRAYLGAPILSPSGDLRGALVLYDRRRRLWRPDEIEALEAFANSATVALQNALLYQAVAQEKEKSEAIIASIADGIVVVDTDGRIEMWNRAAAAMTGVPSRSALRRTLRDVLRSELGDADDRAGRVLLDAERGGNAIEVHLARGERELWLSARAAQLRDPVEDRVGTVYALRDVSEDRQLEMLKSDFVATVSHELRTPLTSIYGFAQTMLRDDIAFPDEDRQTFLSYIASEAERLTRLVDGLLSVTRLEAGAMELDLQELDVREILRETVEREAGRASGAHKLDLNLPASPLLVAADRDKLRQIVLNLVDNAIKYSPDGGTVTVSAQRRLDSVEVRVQDEGIGISAADQRNLFRKFFRADARMTRGIRGIGLGLYLTRGFVAAMGGRIRVESQQGKGSTFIFDLPLRRSSGDGRRAKAKAA
jgi:PAS domain S-box-containing protein